MLTQKCQRQDFQTTLNMCKESQQCETKVTRNDRY